jgi:hypothetical protein
MTQTIEKASTVALQKWLRLNKKLLNEYHPSKECAQLQLCQIHIRNIKAELARRHESC